jgi:O-antigen/teichoic acid export membrane protein
MINKIIRNLKIDKSFASGGIAVFMGTIGVSVLNYLFHLIMGRGLGPENYGVIVAVISLYGLLSIFLSTTNTVVVKYSSESDISSNSEKISYLYYKFLNLALYFGAIIIIILAICSQKLALFLNMDAKYIILLGVFLATGMFASITRGILQGIKQFNNYSINIFLEALAKIIVFIIFFFIGLKTIGAVYSLIIASVLAYFLSLIPLKKILGAKQTKFKLESIKSIFGNTFFALLVISILNFIDVILVKHFFSAHDAGIYSALSNIGKIIIYITFPITIVMFPMISEAHSLNKRHFPLLFQTMILTIIISFLVLAAYYLFPTFIVTILYGKEYLEITSYLFLYGFAMFLLSLITVFVYYFLSIKKSLFLVFLIIGSALELLLISYYHTNISTIIMDLTISFSIILILLIFNYIYYKRNKLAQALKAI